MGKALSLDSKLLTPSGFIEMRAVKVGDALIGADGNPCRVTGVFPQGKRHLFRVTMSDGSSTRCCDEHLWQTQTRAEIEFGMPGSPKPLSDIRATLWSSHLIPTLKTEKQYHRTIMSAEPIGEAECQCITVDAPDHLYVTDDFIVTHNSSLGVKIARCCAERTNSGNKAALLFTLEMPNKEQFERIACEQASIDAKRIKRRTLTDEDMTALTSAMNYIVKLPIFLDDDSTITPQDLRARAIRQHSRTPLGVIVIDSLQLLKPPRTMTRDSRERQVTVIAEDLKALGKELNVPVVALAALNRSLEERPDRRPKLSDLRECVSGDSVVYDQRTGLRTTVGMLAANHKRPLLCGIGEDFKTRTGKLAEAWPTGLKPVFCLRTKTGREITVSDLHPFRTISDWTELRHLAVGMRIAVPRSLPPPSAPQNLPLDEARLIGYLISDGTYIANRSAGYVKNDKVMVADVCRIVRKRFGLEATPHKCQGTSQDMSFTVKGGCGPGGNPLLEWLKELGIHGQRGEVKRIPDAIFRCDNATVAAFLGTLWAGDGTVVERGKNGSMLRFTSTSRALLHDIQHLLLRLGIISGLGRPERNTKSTKDIAALVINESDQIIRFADLITMPGGKNVKLRRAAARARLKGRNARIDRFPLEITDRVRLAARAKQMSWRQLGYRWQGKEMCRADLARCADRLGRVDLAELAQSDVLWDKVVSIEPAGMQEVFDLRVPATGNFVADEIYVHNSGGIEASADIVLFIYRDDYYNKDSSDPGIAELNLAKHRGGETNTVYARWVATLTRFQDLTEEESMALDERNSAPNNVVPFKKRGR
jgi:replicative DNA helicase